MPTYTIQLSTDSADSAETIAQSISTLNATISADDAITMTVAEAADLTPTEMSVQTFIDATASKSPTPGGGSIAALSGALGAALNQMVANLTVRRKKFKAVEDEAYQLRENSAQLQQQLLDAIQADADAFDALMVVYKDKVLPADEKATMLEAATIKASEAPLNTARLSVTVAHEALAMVKIGNPHAVTDAAAAAFMAEAGMRSAALNVRINAVNISDRALASSWLTELDKLEHEVMQLAREVEGISAERGGYA